MFAGIPLPFEIGAGAGDVNGIPLPIQVHMVRTGPDDDCLHLFLVPMDDLNGSISIVGVSAALNLAVDITG